MKLNLDPNKQAQEPNFSNRTKEDSSLCITFNNSKIETISSLKISNLSLMHDLISTNI